LEISHGIGKISNVDHIHHALRIAIAVSNWLIDINTDVCTHPNRHFSCG